MPVIAAGSPKLGAIIKLSADWAVPASSWTVIPHSVVVQDDSGFFDPSTAGTLTIPAGLQGWYSLSASIVISSALSTLWGLRFLLGGSAISGDIVSASRQEYHLATIRYLEAGNVITSTVWKGTTTARNLLANSHAHLGLVRL